MRPYITTVRRWFIVTVLQLDSPQCPFSLVLKSRAESNLNNDKYPSHREIERLKGFPLARGKSFGKIAACPTVGNVLELDLSQDFVASALSERYEKYETIRKMYETIKEGKKERDPRVKDMYS